MTHPAINRLEGIPTTALIMGGDWDKTRPPEDLILSPESILRVQALGVLAENGMVDRAIFTAGLTAGPKETPEAAVQRRYFDEQYPRLGTGLELYEEDLGHTTKMDAVHTRELMDELDMDRVVTLVSTEIFLRRQARIFEREGFDVTPVAAEPLVRTISVEWTNYVNSYHASARYQKMRAMQIVLRGLQLIDPESRATEFLAARSRQNHRLTTAS